MAFVYEGKLVVEDTHDRIEESVADEIVQFPSALGERRIRREGHLIHEEVGTL